MIHLVLYLNRGRNIYSIGSVNVLINCLAIIALSHAHFIHIDHNEFRASGFPRPHLPPPLPHIDQLAQHLPAKELSPVELMVDLSNDLTNRILHYHSILNRNNFAFSPTALESVLVALYEGSAGHSATEIKNVLQLPNNRDVIRVGNRDIHRRLRTYFFGSDNPLKGLSLNKNNVTISQDYETVLMFYGYDLSIDMVSSTNTTTTETPKTANTNNATLTTNATAMEMSSETTTTLNDLAETTTIVADTTTEIIQTTTEVPQTTTTTTTTTTTETTTPETTTPETTTTTEIPTTTTESTTASAEEETETSADTEAEEETTEENAELVSAFVAEADAEPLLRIQKARVTRLPTSKLQAPLKQSYVMTPKPKYLPSARSIASFAIGTTTTPTTTTKKPKSRKLTRPKRHILGFKDLETSLFVSLFNPPAPHHSIFPISAGSPTAAELTHINNEFQLDINSHYLADHTNSKQNYNADVISHVFYLGHQQIVHTTFKVYNAVLYYKYFENLKISVLELELDTPEYNLMIFLPDYHLDIVAAAASLKLGPTLRLLRKQLKPRWVQAIIPDFKLQGTMFLTNDLQNLGICDIFEPNRADFRPMTDEKGIYVRHIEQSINVNIRTHPINQLKRNYGAQTKPIQISVNHPFLFFIIDRDLDVAVMAGRILNPLNVRIQ